MKIKLIDKYIIKELISPFFLSLFVLIFVLMTQFLIKHLDRFLGKGIEITTILKFLLFHSAAIVSMAAPMAILVATMMAFGRFSSDNEIAGFKASGISYYKFLRPGLFFGLVVVMIMIPFNLWILPEMHHNLRKLSYTISKNRPDIEIKENMLNPIYEKIIYVGDRINNNSFNDIVIFDKEDYRDYTTILAEKGYFNSLDDGLILNLYEGSIHESNSAGNNEYRKTYFNNYKIIIPFDQINLNKNKIFVKQDREMNFTTLREKIASRTDEIIRMKDINKEHIQKIEKNLVKKDELHKTLESIDKTSSSYRTNYVKINQLQNSINNMNNNIKKNNTIIPLYLKDINRYNVELHKRFSIPIACLIFILLGIPLGIISKKGNFSISIAISLGFFIIYWALLTLGQFLGDEGKINAGLSTWLGNIFIGLISLYLFYISSNENISINKKIMKIKNVFIKGIV